MLAYLQLLYTFHILKIFEYRLLLLMIIIYLIILKNYTIIC